MLIARGWGTLSVGAQEARDRRSGPDNCRGATNVRALVLCLDCDGRVGPETSSMCRFLTLFFAVLLGCTTLAAAEGKTLRMAYDADPTSLDPHEQLASATLQLSHLVFDPLIRRRQDNTFEPRLADIMGTSGLAWHQWNKHGRCSGLSSDDYFALSRDAYGRVARPDPD